MRPQPIPPQAGQESVWDYPRPPRLERSPEQLKIIFNDLIIANTKDSYRVLETSHPPVYYLPPTDICMEYLQNSDQKSSFCEWKGFAGYYHIEVNKKRINNAAWFYNDPTSKFTEIKNYVAFYPAVMDACYVGEQLVRPQPGEFYGGWVTDNIVGPFKGEPGSWGW